MFLEPDIAIRNDTETTADSVPIQSSLECSECQESPIIGLGYKCTVREGYVLCADCWSIRADKTQPDPMAAVYCPKRTGRERVVPKRYEPVLKEKAEKRKPRVSEDVCFMCDDGGLLLECHQCPKVYHKECLCLTTVPTDPLWSCPWHSCIECDRNMSGSGGVQLRCMTCCISYCFDCWPTTKEIINVNPPTSFFANFVRRGYPVSKNIAFFRCEDCEKSRGKYVQPADVGPLAKYEQMDAIPLHASVTPMHASVTSVTSSTTISSSASSSSDSSSD